MGSGITASQLIAILQKQIAIHGDCEVWSGGQDYPSGVKGVVYTVNGNTYVPKKSFKIW